MEVWSNALQVLVGTRPFLRVYMGSAMTSAVVDVYITISS